MHFFPKIEVAPNELYFGPGTGCHVRNLAVYFIFKPNVN